MPLLDHFSPGKTVVSPSPLMPNLRDIGDRGRKINLVSSLAPNKIVDLFRLGEGTPPDLGISNGEVVDGFYSFLGFT